MTLLSADTFDRTNSTTNLGSTDGAGSEDPFAWVQQDGTWGIISNRAYTSAAISNGVATVDLADADVDISLTLATLTGAGNGIAFRFSNTADFWFLRNLSGSTQLWKRAAGSSTQIGSNVTGGAAGDVMRVVCNGSSIECYRNGSLIMSTTDAHNASATLHGLYSNNNTTGRLDSFSASTLADTVEVPILNASPTLFQPAVVGPQQVTVPQLTASPTLFPPTVQGGGQNVFANLLTASPTVHSPAVLQQFTISPNLLNAAPTFFAPGVGQTTTPTGATVPAFAVRITDVFGTNAFSLPSAQPEEIVWTLNEPTTGTLEFPKSAYSAAQVPALGTPSSVRLVQISYDDDLLAKGLVIQTDGAGSDGKITCHWADQLWALFRTNIDAPRDNRLTNGSFESGFTSWTVQDDVTATASAAHKVLGTQSARLESSVSGGDTHIRQTVQVGPNGVGILLTVVGHFYLESITAPAFASIGLFVEGGPNNTVVKNNYSAIDTATDRNIWVRREVTLRVPPNERWDITVKAFAPNGVIYWDALALVEMDSVGSGGLIGSELDIASIAGILIAHCQDPANGKSNLNVGTHTPANGVTLSRVYQFAEHVGLQDALEEFVNRDDGFDQSLQITPTTSSYTTHTPNKGTDRSGSVTLEYGANVADYRFSRDGSGTITRATFMGQGDGPDREEGEYADATQVGGLILQEVRQAPPDAEINSLLPLARDRVKKRRLPPLLLELDVPYSAGLLHTLKEGDRVSVEIDDGYVQISGTRRIVKRRLTCRTRLMTYFVNEELD